MVIHLPPARMFNIVQRVERQPEEPFLREVTTRRNKPIRIIEVEDDEPPTVVQPTTHTTVKEVGTLSPIVLEEADNRRAIVEDYFDLLLSVQKRAMDSRGILDIQRARKAAAVYTHNSDLISTDLIKELYDSNKHLRKELEDVLGAIMNAKRR